MKRVVILMSAFLLIFFAFPVISAGITIVQNPLSLYNLGDIISIPIKITASSETTETFKMNLICNGAEVEIIKLPVYLTAGEEVQRNDPVPLIKSFIGDLKETCRIKYIFGSETKLTNEFKISSLININLITEENDFSPLQEIILEGQAKKENGAGVNGFIDMEFVQSNESADIFASDTVKDGLFALKFSLPKETASGQYVLKINVSEKDSKGDVTNTGLISHNIFVKQVPTNLETILENNELEPGETLKVKAILHDQTGEQISTTAKIIIQDSRGKIIEETEISTDNFLEMNIPSNNLPEKWTIKTSSNEIQDEADFKVKAVEKVSTEILNKTLIVTNTGNVYYNKTLLVKIGDEPLNIDVELDIGESKKYTLSAPNGKYDVEIVADGKSNINGNVFLTGKAVEIDEAGLTLENKTILWIIIIVILGFFGMKLFRKWHKKSFFGYPGSGKFTPQKKDETVQLRKTSVVTRNKAELSLSVKGDQQDISLVCLRIKNIDRLKESKTDYEPVLQQIINIAEEQKAYIYGAQDNIFLIYAPTKTKTFRNERTAINTARKITDLVEEYNKLAREKIALGISANYGTIVAGTEENVMKFMSMGTLMNGAKKLASLSDGELLLSERMRDKLGPDIKTQKKEVSGTTTYIIREIRDDEKSKEFIRRFLDRMEK